MGLKLIFCMYIFCIFFSNAKNEYTHFIEILFFNFIKSMIDKQQVNIIPSNFYITNKLLKHFIFIFILGQKYTYGRVGRSKNYQIGAWYVLKLSRQFLNTFLVQFINIELKSISIFPSLFPFQKKSLYVVRGVGCLKYG